jgi:hypothetical protein
MCADTPPFLVFLYTVVFEYRKILSLPHTDQLIQYIVGKGKSPINDGKHSLQGFFLTIYSSTHFHVTLMYVKEPKQIVTGKFCHCQRVSEENSFATGGVCLYLVWRREVEQPEQDVPMVHHSAAPM